MKTYSSPEVVEVGIASEAVRGFKADILPDNDGSGEVHLAIATVLDVD